MRNLRCVIVCFTLFLLASAVLSCGTGMATSNMQPQSITINPATANAQKYPGGQVPFVATGNFVDPSHKITPQPVLWGVCQKGMPTTGVTINQTGVGPGAHWDQRACTPSLGTI